MAIKGAILGDILGSQYEFNRPRNLDWKNVPLIMEDKHTSFTDDTVMMLAIKKALDEKLDLVETMVEIGRQYPYCGFGGHFYDWIMTDDHRPYNSWGNGSAMRVAYVADYFTELTDVQKWAKKTAEVSHNHPEGIKGAVVTATCIWMAKNGKSKQEIYDYVLEQYPKEDYEYSIAYSLEKIRPRYKWNESCQGSVPAAMRCFYESTDYESFIRNVYSLPCDSDTFGAIAGGVAEEFYHGFDDIDADGIMLEYLDSRLYPIFLNHQEICVELRREGLMREWCQAKVFDFDDQWIMAYLDSEPHQNFGWHKGEEIAIFVEKKDDETIFYSNMNPSRPVTEEMLADGSVLKEAIETFNNDRSENNFIEVLELLRDSYVWIPCNAVMSGVDEEQIMKMVEAAGDDIDSLVGQTFTSNDDVRLIPDTLQNGDAYFFPVFSSAEEMGDYGNGFSKVQKHFLDVIAMAKDDEKLSGIVVNAFSRPFVLEAKVYDLVERLKSRIIEKQQDALWEGWPQMTLGYLEPVEKS